MPKTNPAKAFMITSFLVMLVASFIYLGATMQAATKVASPYDDIFQEDSIAVSQKPQETPHQTKDEGAFLVPVGMTTGITFYTDGILVLTISDINTSCGHRASPSKGKLKAGDIIKKANDQDVKYMADLSKVINASTPMVTLDICRDGVEHKVQIEAVEDDSDKVKKIGCWVRDATQGLGTITYYNPKDNSFGALGHGVVDVDTQKILQAREGYVVEANIVDIKKGEKGKPGELIGEIKTKVIGHITANNSLGIYGKIDPAYISLPSSTYPTARRDELKKGPAKILSNVENGQEIKSYDIFIENINEDTNAEKAMVIRITDPALIARTNGIVQGMSGSPIMQNNKLLGAITHVFLQNPSRGYGVHIDKMTMSCEK